LVLEENESDWTPSSIVIIKILLECRFLEFILSFLGANKHTPTGFCLDKRTLLRGRKKLNRSPRDDTLGLSRYNKRETVICGLFALVTWRPARKRTRRRRADRIPIAGITTGNINRSRNTNKKTLRAVKAERSFYRVEILYISPVPLCFSYDLVRNFPVMVS
jgi:hypothetical protein